MTLPAPYGGKMRCGGCSGKKSQSGGRKALQRPDIRQKSNPCATATPSKATILHAIGAHHCARCEQSLTHCVANG